MPQVSILIPSYNHARFLRTCLATVRAQTFRDWEALVVDDGSSDDSVEIVGRNASEDDRIKLYENATNIGTYGTEQRALEMSDSRYVAVLNSDDLWHPRKLEAQVAQLEDDPSLPLSYVLGHIVDADTRISKQDVHAYWPTEPKQNVIQYLLFENRILASSVLFRRDGLRFETSLRYSGDWVALLERARGKVGCVPERLSYWRVHGRNTFTMSDEQMLEEIRVRHAIHSQRRLFDDYSLGPHRIDWGLGHNALNLVACHLYFGDRAVARRWGLRAFKHWHSVVSLKRLFSTFLPTEKAMQHLWKDQARSWTSEEISENRTRVASLPPLHFQMGVRNAGTNHQAPSGAGGN